MIRDTGVVTTAIGRHYGPAAEAEWRRVSSHFALNDGFALLVLIVPDSDGAALCQLVLSDLLYGDGRQVLDMSPDSPSALRQLAPSLLRLRVPPACGVVWLAAAVPHTAEDHAAWDMAWRWGLATLNQNRNPLRRRIDRTLVLVGVPELVPLFRESAPDLWSVRSLVVWIEPDPDLAAARREQANRDQRLGSRRAPAGPVPDLDLALAEINRLRDMPGRERDLATMVERAAWAYAGRGNAPAAEACFREALDLRDRCDGPVAIAGTLLNLGDILLDQARSAEAEAMFRRTIVLAEKGSAMDVLRASALDLLAHALLAQGRAAEAEAVFRRSLHLAEEGGATADARGVMTDMLARAILTQGRPAEAEAVFRQALALIKAGSSSSASLGITMEMLAHAILAQDRPAEAEATFREALALAEQGGATAVSRAVTTKMLAHAVLAQGRATEAEALFRGAVSLAEAHDAPSDLLRIMTAERRTSRRGRKGGKPPSA
jgi:tetratricopeptide (TPR) repeat protein